VPGPATRLGASFSRGHAWLSYQSLSIVHKRRLHQGRGFQRLCCQWNLTIILGWNKNVEMSGEFVVDRDLYLYHSDSPPAPFFLSPNVCSVGPKYPPMSTPSGLKSIVRGTMCMYVTCPSQGKLLRLPLWMSHSSRTMPMQIIFLGWPLLWFASILVPSSMNPLHVSYLAPARLPPSGIVTHIFLYILNAGILSSNTVNDIRRNPNSRKPYVITQCMTSVPKPRPRDLALNAILTAASRSGCGLKLRLTCPKNSRFSLSSTTTKKIEPLDIDCTVVCRNCSIRVGVRSSIKDSRWTTGSVHRFKNAPSSDGTYRRKKVRLVSHSGECVGACMMPPPSSGVG